MTELDKDSYAEIQKLTMLLPEGVKIYLEKFPYINELYEIVLDLGIVPQIRYHKDNDGTEGLPDFEDWIHCLELDLPVITQNDINNFIEFLISLTFLKGDVG